MSMFRRFVKDDSGATAIEYGLIAALVSVAIIVALGTLGTELGNTFNEVANELAGASTPAP
jgi:pilus assembly protein Flp/PilA